MGLLLLVLATLAGPVPCHTRGVLPDPLCTPGAVATADRDVVCRETARGRRRVTAAERIEAFSEYGIAYPAPRGAYEVDHLIPLELGGDNAIANLWPEPAPSFHAKDRLENRLHREVCTGRMDLVEAQRAIAADWLRASAALDAVSSR
jgi:hypothetical protein